MVTYDQDDPDEQCLAIPRGGLSKHLNGDFEPFFEEDELTPRDNFGFQPYAIDKGDDCPVSESGWSTNTTPRKTTQKVSLVRDSFEPIEDIVLKCFSIEVLALVHDSWELLKSVGHQVVFDIERDVAAPSIADVEHLFSVLHDHVQLEYEVALLSLIYIKRLCGPGKVTSPAQTPPLSMSPRNWRAVTIACVRLATKAWDDFHVLNSHFIEPFSDLLDLRSLCALETAALAAMDHHLWVAEIDFQNLHSVVKARYACLARGDREESVLAAAFEGEGAVSTAGEAGSAVMTTGSCSPQAPHLRNLSKSWSWKRSKSNRVAVAGGEGEGGGTEWGQASSTDPMTTPSPSGSRQRSPASEKRSQEHSSNSPTTAATMRGLWGFNGSGKIVVHTEKE